MTPALFFSVSGTMSDNRYNVNFTPLGSSLLYANPGFSQKARIFMTLDDHFRPFGPSVYKKPPCSENRTNLTKNLSTVTNNDTRLPSLSYSPVGLDNVVSESVLAYLAGAESREPNVWLKDDIRIAWLTVLHCAEGIADPWRFAFWKYLGATPEKIIPQLVARAEAHRMMNVPDYDPTVRIRKDKTA